jgi:hypothetical protein
MSAWIETKAKLAGETRLSPDELRKIPPATLQRLGEPAIEGFRHTEMNELLPQLLGNGLNSQRCFELFRARYDNGPDGVTDNEIRSLISHHVRIPYQASGRSFAGESSAVSTPPFVMPKPRPKETPEQAKERKKAEAIGRVEAFVGRDRGTVEDLIDQSPFSAEQGPEQAALFFSIAYPNTASLVNFLAKFTLDPKGKANPVGAGRTMTVRDWRKEWFERGRVPESDAGCWFRPNILKAVNGSGFNGAICDRDVLAVRTVILESDVLPLSLQASFFIKALKRNLPIRAIVDSGGKSLQAHVLVSDRDEAVRVVSKLEIFGFDQATKNPSRLCRLPGAVRKIGARDPANGTLQRLVYLNGETST